MSEQSTILRDNSDDGWDTASRNYDDSSPEPGFSFGAMFYGWLVSVSFPALLAGVLGAAAAAAGVTLGVSRAEAEGQAETIGIVAGVVLAVLVLLGYLAGGYVAGRMTRSHGGRRGVTVWLLSLLSSGLVTAVGVMVDSRYDLQQELGISTVDLPELFDWRGLLVFAGVALVTLLAAYAGGRMGQRYHHRHDDPWEF